MSFHSSEKKREENKRVPKGKKTFKVPVPVLPKFSFLKKEKKKTVQ